MDNKPVVVPWDLEVTQHLLEQEGAQHLDQLHMALLEVMELVEEWDLEEHQEVVVVVLWEEHSVVEETVLLEDLEVEEVVDLVDNKIISYPSDIQVSSKNNVTETTLQNKARVLT